MSIEINQRKFNSQIEIADLIGEAVQNASARRNQVIDAEESFLDISGEEIKGISGGTIGTITMGYFPTSQYLQRNYPPDLFAPVVDGGSRKARQLVCVVHK